MVPPPRSGPAAPVSGPGGAGDEAVEEGVDGEAESLVAATADQLRGVAYEERKARGRKAGECVTDPGDGIVAVRVGGVPRGTGATRGTVRATRSIIACSNSSRLRT